MGTPIIITYFFIVAMNPGSAANLLGIKIQRYLILEVKLNIC